MKFKMLICLASLLLFPLASAATNVSLMYGWNGTNFVPLLTEADGTLSTNLNLSRSIGLVPDANASYDLGSSQLEWRNLFAVRGQISRNLSIGSATSRQALDVTGGHISIDQDSLIILNGSATTEYLSFDSANKRIRFNVRDTAGYGFAFTNNTGTASLFIGTNNRVGIGTATPSYTLEVAGTANITQTLYVEGINISARQSSDNTTLSGRITSENTTVANNLTAAGARIGNLEAKQSGDNTTQSNLITGNNNTLVALLGQKLNLTGGILSGRLSVAGADVANISLNVSNALYVNHSSGNVGIGTSSPETNLHIIKNLVVNSNSSMIILDTFSSGGTDYAGYFTMRNARGSIDAPLVQWGGRQIGGFKMEVYNGTQYIPAGRISSITNTHMDLPGRSTNMEFYVNSLGDEYKVMTLSGSSGATGASFGDGTPTGDAALRASTISNDATISFGTNGISHTLGHHSSDNNVFGISINDSGWFNNKVFIINNDKEIGMGSSPTNYYGMATISAINTSSKPILSLYTSGAATGNKAFEIKTSWNSVNTILNDNGGAIFNEQGNDANFRIESNTNANAFFLKANTSSIGIGTGAPSAGLQINASNPTLRTNGTAIFDGNVGIGTTGPSSALEIARDSSDLLTLEKSSGAATIDAIRFTAGGSELASLQFDANEDLIWVQSTDRNMFFQGGSRSEFTFGSSNENGAKLSVENIDTSIHLVALHVDQQDNDADIFQAQADGNDVFSIKYSGNVGIGTTSPNYKLDVKGDINATSYRSNGTDYAEWMRVSGNESISAGDVVAVVNGKITNPANPGTGTPALYMVVTDSAGVIGNGGCPANECEPVAFIGQVRTKVSGIVNEGDYILADGSNIGYAKSKDATSFDEFKKKVVGIALESKSNTGTARILVAVGVK